MSCGPRTGINIGRANLKLACHSLIDTNRCTGNIPLPLHGISSGRSRYLRQMTDGFLTQCDCGSLFAIPNGNGSMKTCLWPCFSCHVSGRLAQVSWLPPSLWVNAAKSICSWCCQYSQRTRRHEAEVYSARRFGLRCCPRTGCVLIRRWVRSLAGLW